MSDVLLVVFTGVVAGCTLLYCCLTGWLAWETRRMRQLQTEPRISIRAEYSTRTASGGMELVIRNEGQGVARNIKFTFEGDPNHFVGSGSLIPVDQIRAIRDGLSHLGPSQRFDIIIGWLDDEKYVHAKQNPWIFHVLYENQIGETKEDHYVVDFSEFDSLMLVDSSPLFDIEKHLRRLRQDFEHLTNGTRSLRVITQTKDEFRAERAEQLAKLRPRHRKPDEDSSKVEQAEP